MTFAEYFTVLQKRWRIWVAGLLLGVAGAVTLTSLATVQYTASTTSFVTVADQGEAGGGAIFQQSQFAVLRMSSYADLVKSPDVLDGVIRKLQLPYDIRELRRKVHVSSPPETVLLKVSATDPSNSRAAAIANVTAAELGRYIQTIETPAGADNSNVKVTLSTPATPPARPSAPRPTVNILFGLVLGFGVGFVAALVRHHFDRRIKSADDIRAITGMSSLGVTLKETDFLKRPLVALDWRSASAERYRTVRTALKFATIDRELRHFVVSSPMAGDGKTTVSCNLAISWAQSGATVCLVEADLRRPNVSRFLGIEGNIGLSDVLVGDAELDDVLTPWHKGSVTVFPAGSLPPDPVALLGSEAMHALVKRLRSRFDVVIYDSPPLLSVTDAVVLSQSVDGLMLVVRWARTSREQLQTCVDLVRTGRGTLIGTVLSAMRLRGKAAQHGYYSADLAERAELRISPDRLRKVEDDSSADVARSER